MPSKFVLTVIKVAVSAALVYWILRGSDLDVIFASIRSADVQLLAVAFAMFYVGYVISAHRWQILLAAQGVTAPFGYLLQSFMVVVFFNNFLPSTIGGDLVRMYDSYRIGGSRTGSVSVIIIDRFFGTIAQFVYALIALIAVPGVRQQIPLLPLWVTLGVCGISLFVYVVFGSPDWLFARVAGLSEARAGAIVRLIKKVMTALRVFKGRRDVLVKALGLSFLLQLNVIVHFIILSQALGIEVPLMAMFVIVPIASVLMALPISINAIGVREAVFVYLFALFAVPREQAVAFAWIAFGFVLLQGVIGGIVFAARRNAKRLRGEPGDRRAPR